MQKLPIFMKALLLFFILAAASCQDKYPDLEDGLYAEIVTDKGTIVAKLEYEKVPNTVANFVSLAEGTNTFADSTYQGKKYYNGLKFHRVIKDFMIQGGDPTGTGSSGPGYKFEDEFSKDLKHDKKGILAMANSGYGTNGSQFYITHKATSWLDAYDAKGNLKPCKQPRVSCHAVFGEVVMGQDVVDSIAQNDVMKEVNIIRKGSAAKKFDAAVTFENYFAEADKRAKEKEAAQKAAVASQKALLDGYDKQAKALESGIKLHYITKGTGPKPKVGTKAMINYEGYFTDGSIFDSNVKEAEEKQGKLNEMKVARDMYKPFPMKVSPDAQLIAGFRKALANMQVGDKVYVYIPYHLAYGEAGRGSIPPKSDLTFIMEMVDLEKK